MPRLVIVIPRLREEPRQLGDHALQVRRGVLAQLVHGQVGHLQAELGLELGPHLGVHHRLQRARRIVVQELHRIVAHGNPGRARPAGAELHLVGRHDPDRLVAVARPGVRVGGPLASDGALVHLDQLGGIAPLAVPAGRLVTELDPLLGNPDLLGSHQVGTEELLVVGGGLFPRVAGVRDQEALLVGADRLELHRLERLSHAAGQEDQHERRSQELLNIGHAVGPLEQRTHAAERQHEADEGPGPVAKGHPGVRLPVSLADPPGHGVVVLELTQVEVTLLLDCGGPLGGTGEVGVEPESGYQPQHERTTIQGFHGVFPAFYDSWGSLTGRRLTSRGRLVHDSAAALLPFTGHPFSHPGLSPDLPGPGPSTAGEYSYALMASWRKSSAPATIRVDSPRRTPVARADDAAPGAKEPWMLSSPRRRVDARTDPVRA